MIRKLGIIAIIVLGFVYWMLQGSKLTPFDLIWIALIFLMWKVERIEEKLEELGKAAQVDVESEKYKEYAECDGDSD